MALWKVFGGMSAVPRCAVARRATAARCHSSRKRTGQPGKAACIRAISGRRPGAQGQPILTNVIIRLLPLHIVEAVRGSERPAPCRAAARGRKGFERVRKGAEKGPDCAWRDAIACMRSGPAQVLPSTLAMHRRPGPWKCRERGNFATQPVLPAGPHKAISFAGNTPGLIRRRA